MSKNSFKKEIRERYNGRGNAWVRVEKDTPSYSKIIDNLVSIGQEKSEYVNHIEREGYAWIRFLKPEGTSENPECKFEIRYRGSKEIHLDSFINFSDEISRQFKFLGNTPFKLQLETEPDKRKSKVINKNSLGKTKTQDKKEETLSINEEKEIKIIKEAALTQASSEELEEWYEFLKINNLYEENV